MHFLFPFCNSLCKVALSFRNTMAAGKTVNDSSTCPSPRILELSQPKNSKSTWLTKPSKNLTWGNQESIWPVSYPALTAKPTERIQLLANPKKDFSLGAEEWRKSPTTALQIITSEQLERLSRPKRRTNSYHEHSCPIWHISPRAMTCQMPLRVSQLAHPKTNHPDFKIDREVETCISQSAKRARITPRLEHLALPRIRGNNMFFCVGQPEEAIRPVSKSASRVSANPRTEELAKPKELSKEYLPLREAVWAIARGVRTAVSSPRIQELSKPIMR
ncbi:sperm microtubule associated protein 2 like isoform X2 [Amia ocellicauda]|uniref:sperm microtubule associated protein 2 like isoform X2 n=1 Tax=Amia ocellicauda TaxID=2972642 RepID=UPI003464BD36